MSENNFCDLEILYDKKTFSFSVAHLWKSVLSGLKPPSQFKNKHFVKLLYPPFLLVGEVLLNSAINRQVIIRCLHPAATI